MFIQQTGTGSKTVVGFHGWSGDHHTFDPLLGQMPKDYSFYAPDLPGCGQSDPPKKWKMRCLAQEVTGALIRLNRERMTLVGSCSGAILTAFVASELREMGRSGVLAKLVMIDPFAYCPWYFRIFLIPLIGPVTYTAAFANPVGRVITNLFLREKRVGNTDLTESFAGVDHWVTWKYLKMLFECGQPGQFHGLDVPVDILYGEKTFGAVRRSVREWASALPQASIRELSGVGHLPIQESSYEVAKVVFGGEISRNESS
ncbi:MAG: alpha/beta hydrolase [Verrucomicrobia bacterium]|nr:alpha/beta hydrolase [Verrucomicrobiota bacterium]